MARRRSVAAAFGMAALVASGAALLSATDAGAALIRTTISLADFKDAFGIASIRKMIDNGNGRGIVVYSRRLDANGIPIRISGERADLTKSFLTFRVDTSLQDDPVSAAFQLRVIRKPFRDNNPPEILTCNVGGNLTSGVGSLSCGGGLTVSPS